MSSHIFCRLQHWQTGKVKKCNIFFYTFETPEHNVALILLKQVTEPVKKYPTPLCKPFKSGSEVIATWFHLLAGAQGVFSLQYLRLRLLLA